MVSFRRHESDWRTYLALGGLGLILGRLLTVSLKNDGVPNGGDKQTNKTKANRDYCYQLNEKTISLYSPYEGWHPDEKRHRGKERCYWRLTLILSFFTMAGAGTAAYCAAKAYVQTRSQTQAGWEAAKQAKRQADAASEPYVFGVFQRSNTIFDWLHDGTPIDVGIVLSNYGQGPAIITKAQCSVVFGNPTNVDFSLLDESPISSIEDVPHLDVLGREPIVGKCDDPWPNDYGRTGFNNGLSPTDKITFIMISHPIWVLAKIDYEDVVGNKYESVVCARFELAGGANQKDSLGFQPFLAPKCTDAGDE